MKRTTKQVLVGALGVGLTVTGFQLVQPPAAHAADPTDIQILGTNDFHGRLVRDEAPLGQDCDDYTCPAAVLSGAVKQLRVDNPNTVFAAAGDLIGASTFESFVQDDEPTIEALNESTLDVSAVGNHEFDQGYEDLVGRVQNLADWEYIGANVNEPEGRDDLAEVWTTTVDGVDLGFVGAVTEELPALVSPGGIAGVTVDDIVTATNDAAADLRADGADMVFLLVHEGSSSTSCASPTFTDPNTVWGNITQNTSADVDAIISGHTHLAYNCSFPVDEWVTEGRAVTERPVVSAGQYGQNLNKLVFTYDRDTDTVAAKTQELVALTEAAFPEDPAVVSIVHDAIDFAAPIGAQVLGEIAGPFYRAKLSNGTTDNRGGESTLGNLVAEVQRAETPAEQGGAEIAFMNPGGLRADMVGSLNGEERQLTYRNAATVQPFANGLTNMDMTGAQIEEVLEEQWQRDSNGNLPSRPFLRLGASKGFTYTYVETPVEVPAAPPATGTVSTFEGEVTGMWLNGEAIDPAASYSVTVNSFLATGGDNFRTFAQGTGQAQWGVTDLQAMVDYMAEHTAESPLPVDYSQRAVEVAPTSPTPTGGQLTIDLASFSMSHPTDVKDTVVQAKLGDTVVGSATLDNTVTDEVYDNTGTATIEVDLPNRTPVGRATLMLVGADTGTEVQVPLRVLKGASEVTVTSVRPDHPVKNKTKVKVTVKVTNPDGVKANNKVKISGPGIGETIGRLKDGKVTITLPAFPTAGKKQLKIVYTGSELLKRLETTKEIRIFKR